MFAAQATGQRKGANPLDQLRAGSGAPGNFESHIFSNEGKCGPLDIPFYRTRRERSQSDTATVLMENPIQKAIPKNCCGSR